MEQPPVFRIGTPEQLGDPGETLYEVAAEEAKEGLEWLGIEYDAQYVIDATDLLTEMLRREPKKDTGEALEVPVPSVDDAAKPNDIIARSLWES